MITSIYDNIVAMIEIGTGSVTRPSPKLRDPEGIKKSIGELVKTKMEAIEIAAGTSKNHPSVILHKTLDFMADHLNEVKVSDRKDDQVEVSSVCFYKKNKVGPTYSGFVNKCETMHVSVEVLFKHKELKKAVRALPEKAEELQAMANKKGARPEFKRAKTLFTPATVPVPTSKPVVKRVVSFDLPGQRK